MTIHPPRLALAMYAAALITGCGGGSTPVDGGLGDPVAPATCAIDNGGCSISPMVQCSLGGDGEAQCAACPPDYVGDGRVCTSTSAMDECTLGTHNCSPDATCTDTATAYLCECLDGFFGNGVFCNTGECAHATSWVQYQLTGFSIPTLEQAAMAMPWDTTSTTQAIGVAWRTLRATSTTRSSPSRRAYWR